MRKNLFLKLFIIQVFVFSILFTACTDAAEGNNEPEIPEPPAVTIEGINLTGYKKSFELHEEFTTGSRFSVTAKLSDKTTRGLSKSEYTVDSSKFDNSKLGTFKIKVTVKDAKVSAEYSVSIKQNALRILSIGNSFSEDAQAYLYGIIDSFESYETIVTGSLVIGGCSLNTHYNNARNNSAAYAYRKVTSSGVATASSRTILSALQEEQWDYITIQQVSQDSGRPETILNLQTEYLTNYIRTNVAHSNAKVAWHSTWAYQSNSGHEGFANYGRNQLTMYEAIVGVAQNTIESSGYFDAVIPNTTAVQNARTGYVGDTLTRDGFHMSYGQGRFLTALMFFKALTGASIASLTAQQAAEIVGAGYASEVGSKFLNLAKESVNNAYANPYSITQSNFTA